mmetsp:Transcript_31050/g.49865  ORF Transcript_31050/g.49865 Transcript_31050/m.49865 type:complete len:92 (+) Transcript_31050:15-290(+)
MTPNTIMRTPNEQSMAAPIDERCIPKPNAKMIPMINVKTPSTMLKILRPIKAQRMPQQKQNVSSFSHGYSYAPLQQHPLYRCNVDDFCCDC